MRIRGCRAATLALCVLAGSGQPTAQDGASTSIPGLLDRYRMGDTDAITPLAVATDSGRMRSSFIAAADSWIGREAPDLAHRRLVATAFAIELAQARLAFDSPTLMVLLDWARMEWLKGRPTPAEQVWTGAAVALIGRGGGSTTVGGAGPESARKASTFLEGAVKRFPEDAQLRLALLVWPDGLPGVLMNVNFGTGRLRSLEQLTKEPYSSPDAMLDLAYVRLLEGKTEVARRLAQQAAHGSTESWIRYVSHFLVAVSHERQREYQDAAREYTAALEVVPHAQSASIALGQLLLRDNQAAAAIDLIDRSLTERPDGDDPWRLFPYGGYNRWPALIADVRKAIR